METGNSIQKDTGGRHGGQEEGTQTIQAPATNLLLENPTLAAAVRLLDKKRIQANYTLVTKLTIAKVRCY